MIFDTDVIIAAQRGLIAAAKLINQYRPRKTSIITYMEFIQSPQNKKQLALSKNFFSEMRFEILPVTPEISNRAAMFIERFSLSHGLRISDALIAGTAFEHGVPLASANTKHYAMISGLELVKLRVA